MVIEIMMWFCCGHHVQDGLLVLSGCCDFLLVSGSQTAWPLTGMALNRHGPQPAWPSTGLALNRPGPQPAWPCTTNILTTHSTRFFLFFSLFPRQGICTVKESIFDGFLVTASKNTGPLYTFKLWVYGYKSMDLFRPAIFHGRLLTPCAF